MYQGKEWDGWINVVNVFRASIVLGTPGSGKSYAVVNNYIKQQIEKSFAMYIYDYKFPDLSEIAYNHLLKHKEHYKVKPEFYVINFDDPRRSHRCNPINPKFMVDISDAYESAYTIMLNLNKTWIQKQGDFFVESPIILLAAIIWYLRIYKDGKYCTFPHAIEFLNKPYADIFTILTSYPSLENYLSPFMDAWQSGAQDQLQGQIASAKIPLSRMISPQLYWVMTGDDFTLDLNNPEQPKILCVGNNPDRQNIYSAALGLYNSRIVKLVNKKGQLKSSIIIDELPTIYFRGIDNLIATARSNKVAVCLGFQDFSQLTRDYGEKEAKVIQNTVGNIFSGQVVGETAKNLSERFGKILQQRQSISINRQDTSTSINTQLDSLIPASKIANLSQGTFVGSVADNFGEEIEQKIFHARIIVDNEKVAAETRAYKKIPVINEFKDADGNDIMQQQIDRNYSRIKADVLQIIEDETSLRLRYFSRKPCAIRHGTAGQARNKISALQSRGCLTQKTKGMSRSNFTPMGRFKEIIDRYGLKLMEVGTNHLRIFADNRKLFDYYPLRMKLFDYRQWKQLTYPSLIEGADKWETELDEIIKRLMVSPQ